GSYQKLDPFDIDYKIFDKDKNLIAYAEVKGRIRTMKMAYPLPVSAKKVVKLMDKRLEPVLIWACDDGIIYGRVMKLIGEIKRGGRPPRIGSFTDDELMVYYEKQKGLKYVRYV
ncbi:MAG: hypothetical protein ACK5DE_03820, partial [Bacteroidota bacterium]